MAKKRNVGDDDILNKDRISELPLDLIESILGRISINEAARTSILSKKWRYIWSTLPQLVLDRQFFLGITPNKRQTRDQFWRIIDKILIFHNAPIIKFVIHIPFAQSLDMDTWMLILSRNGVKELTLDNRLDLLPYKLPSSIFSCDQLTCLQLCNCELNPPLAFSGFSNLKNLDLNRISLSANTGSLISTLSSLDRLTLQYCSGVENLKNLPPNINCFRLANTPDLHWKSFHSKPNISLLVIFLGKQVENVDAQGKHFTLMTLLANLPRLVDLCLDGFSLKFLAAGISPKLYPSYKLICVGLFGIRFNDLDQVSCALCLLRSSPNLQKLKIEGSKSKVSSDDDVAQHDLDKMELAANSDMTLNLLRSVKLRFFKGLKTELLLVKLLLSHSPSLQQIIIERSSEEMSADQEFRISRQLMMFCRASAVSEIIYEKPNSLKPKLY